MKKKESLHIAMLGHKRIPSREGGVEIVVSELSTRMVKRGYDVTCYNRRGHHIAGEEFDVKNVSEYKGVRIKDVFTIKKGGLAAMSSSVFATIRATFGKYDVIHFHAEGPCAMMWLPKMFGKRCVATIHGLDHQRAKWGKFARLYIMMGEKCAVKFADEIIVLSENVADYFKEKYQRKTIFIPNGVNKPEKVKANLIKEKYGVEENEYILFLGRLVPEKGVHYLLKAYEKLNTDKRLVIAGGASDTEEYAGQLRQLANDNPKIIFTGFVQGKALEELYSNAYLYVLPSDLEGMPLSLLEAMSYGNCCVTSDICECTQVIGELGFTFKKGDEEDLQKTLNYLLENTSVVNEIKNKSAKYICEKYNWDEVVDKTLNVYGL